MPWHDLIGCMNSAVISVGGGRGPAVFFACWPLVKYTYVRIGIMKMDRMTAAWVVAENAIVDIFSEYPNNGVYAARYE
jgi:hypothetical protein